MATLTISDVERASVGIGVDELYFNLTIYAYGVGGVAIDLSSYFKAKILSVTCHGANAGDWVTETRCTDRADLSSGWKLKLSAIADPNYGDYSAHTAGMIVYMDADAARGKVNTRVPATGDPMNVVQKNRTTDVEDGLGLGHITFIMSAKGR